LRYAVFFTPPADDPLTETAATWLGRDAFGRGSIDPPQVPGLDLAALTAEPRRYGFHGTLKAPFHLMAGRSEADLITAFDAFVRDYPAFTIPQMVVGAIGPFFALVPADGAEDGISGLADACVKAFEPLRAPLSEADIARRLPERLDESQRAYLAEWGYPYVFDAFRFHMTLTGAVPEEDRPAMRQLLDATFAPFAGKPMRIGHLALFAEPERGAPFTVLRLAKLGDTDNGRIA
jgi:putative phosphonate metabolism protein